MSVVRRVASWPRALARRIWRLPRWLSIPGGLVVVGLLAFAGYQGVSVYSYTQDNPSFCRSCHIMEGAWDKWATSEHREINCHECHEISPLGGAKLLLTFAVAHPDKVGQHASVPDEACVQCHGNGDPRWKQVEATAGHKVHVEEQGIPCTQCHSTSLHSFTPPETICQECHTDKKLAVEPMAQENCLTCHQYLRSGGPPASPLTPSPGRASGGLLSPSSASSVTLSPSRDTCLECHQQQQDPKINWPSDASMQFQCGQCHEPHVQAPPTVDCKSCHREDVAQGTVHTLDAHQPVQCWACHQPHQWTAPKQSTCLDCHQDQLAHKPAEDYSPGGQCTQCH